MNKIKRKILLVFGTRPEAIKMAPLIKELKTSFNVIVCSTGQHKEMLDQVLDVFQIKPDIDLEVMKEDQDLFDVSSTILSKFKNFIGDINPELVLVHGDTTSSMVSALSAFYNKIPVGHVEAGLRTNNKYSPFPEEINRQLISRLSTFHFAPTELSKLNLLKENIPEDKIVITGNTVIDALLQITEKIKDIPFSNELLKKLPFLSKDTSKVILVTGHRRENYGKGMEEIAKSLELIASRNPELKIVYPVHMNKNLKKDLKESLYREKNIFLIEPLDYINFVKLMLRSYIILTDSGGIQEEAPSLNKPVLLMRENTERPEAVSAGTVRMVGANHKNIITEVDKLLSDERYYESMVNLKNPYGDGKASEKILSFLLKQLS